MERVARHELQNEVQIFSYRAPSIVRTQTIERMIEVGLVYILTHWKISFEIMFTFGLFEINFRLPEGTTS